MGLTQRQIKVINDMISNLDENISFEEKHEELMDKCLDKELFDLEDDEDGDIYQGYSNEVWDFLENIINN
jgi:hypothetical protein